MTDSSWTSLMHMRQELNLPSTMKVKRQSAYGPDCSRKSSLKTCLKLQKNIFSKYSEHYRLL